MGFNVRQHYCFKLAFAERQLKLNEALISEALKKSFKIKQ